MNTLLRFLVLAGLLCVATLRAADDVAAEKMPELRGVLADGSGKRFGLFIPSTEQTGWAKVGETVGGWKLKEYRAADDTLVLAKDGREEILHLSESVVGVYHKGSQADAEALFKAMKFDERINKEFAKNMDRLLKQLLIRNGIANPTPEQIAEFQKKVAGIFDPAQLESKMAAAMGEVYTQEEFKAQTDFYASDAGQAVLDTVGMGRRAKDGSEPAALKDFYATPVGASVKAKQAQLNNQMQKTVGPWMGAVMGQTQKAAVEFAKSQGASPAAPTVNVTTP